MPNGNIQPAVSTEQRGEVLFTLCVYRVSFSLAANLYRSPTNKVLQAWASWADDARLMSRGIFLINEKNEPVEMREEPYGSEAMLQKLLADHPAILAGDQIDRENPRRWLFITQELSLASEEDGAGRWFVDHLFIDQDAVPTIIEVKRSTDTRIRREVVGQMLDYAANAVVRLPVQTIRERFEVQCERRGKTPEQELSDALGVSNGEEAFWQQVKVNLQAGKVRLVFVADEIPSELRRIVEFLNQQMDPAEVLAVEIKQYVAGNLRTLVPSVIGQTEEAHQRKSTGAVSQRVSRRWDEESFFQELRTKVSTAEGDVARQLFGWAKEHATYIRWGKGSQNGSFSPVLEHMDEEYSLFGCYTSGSVEATFDFLRWKPALKDEAKRLELRELLNRVAGFSIAESEITKRPSIRLTALAQGSALADFLAVMDWLIATIKSYTR